MSLLRNLWYGNIRPNEQFFYYTSEYKLLITEASSVMEQLQKKLTPEEQLLLEGYCNTHAKLAGLSEEQAFIYGVRLGARLMLDVMNWEDSADRTV